MPRRGSLQRQRSVCWFKEPSPKCEGNPVNFVARWDPSLGILAAFGLTARSIGADSMRGAEIVRN